MKYYILTSSAIPKNRLQEGINRMADAFNKHVLSSYWEDFFEKITQRIEELNRLNPRCKPAKVTSRTLQVDKIILLSIEIESSPYKDIKLHLIKGEATL